MLDTMTVNCPFPQHLKNVDGRYIMGKACMIVLVLDDDMVAEIKKNDPKSLLIAHIPIETPTERYERNLRELIRFFIYESKSIIKHNYMDILSRTPEFHAISQRVCTEEQKKITDNNFKVFPNVKRTCFDKAIHNAMFTTRIDEDEILHMRTGELKVEQITEPPGGDADDYVTLDDLQLDPQTEEPVIIFMKETFTCPIRTYKHKFIPEISIGIEGGAAELIIERKMLKSRYMKTHTTEEEYEKFMNPEKGDVLDVFIAQNQ